MKSFVAKTLIAFIGWMVSMVGLTHSQTYNFQNGFSMAGGFSATTHLDKNYKAMKEKDISGQWGFSYEIGYMNTKSLSEKAAFTYGLSISSIRNSFKTGPIAYSRRNGSGETINFLNSNQREDKYLLGISCKWIFFFNRGAGRFFAGPGFSFSAPVYNVSDVSGATAESDSVSFKERFFTEKGPYLFIPLEPTLGYQKEFGDCSLLRVELFSLFRGEGIVTKSDPIHFEKFIGLRAYFFFGTE